jgi:hypothetical protein
MASFDLLIRFLAGDELQSFVPDQRYWLLRELLRSGRTSMAEEDKAKAKLVVLRIEFRNPSEESIELEFANVTCKAELFNLDIHDDLGTAIAAVSRVHIRPLPGPRPLHIIPPFGSHVYDLVGETVEGWLVFPGAKYQIPPNGKMHVRFKYGSFLSNFGSFTHEH